MSSFIAQWEPSLIPMYFLLEYSTNYSMTSGSLRKSYRDEVKDNANEINAVNYRISI